MNIRGIEIETLVTLEALLTELNVTRVARRLHLSQPTVSVRLAKLRRLFNDPLLVPGPRGMRPTARGLELASPLREALGNLERMLRSHSPFEPATAELTWHVAASDYAETAILVPLIARLRRASPGILVAVHVLQPREVARRAERGDIDAALMTSDTTPETLHRLPLFTEHYCFVGRRRHPGLRGPLGMARFCALEHIVVSPDGGGFSAATDVLLQSQQRKRRVVLSVPGFLAVPDLIRNSDLVAMLPSRVLEGRMQGLQIHKAPANPPGYEMAMSWHERVHADPAQAWIRSQIALAVSCSAPIARRRNTSPSISSRRFE